MRFSVRGLDASFTYPVTKADVREAFGSEPLESAFFGPQADHAFSRRDRVLDIPGRVLVKVSVSTWRWPREEIARQRASLYAYRVRKIEWSDYLHWQVREIMRAEMRPWAEAMIARPEIGWGPQEELLVELCEGVLRLHRRRAK